MKQILVFILLLVVQFSFGQLSGDLAISKRPVVKDFYFEVEGHKPGRLTFTISVDESGKVVSCKLDKMASTGYSTPTMVKAINHIKANLQFKAGSEYPQFHTGVIAITILKP
ncbi:MAG: hypothetical protein AB8B74_07465 [Crocinitomicaceae bacterium]